MTALRGCRLLSPRGGAWSGGGGLVLGHTQAPLAVVADVEGGGGAVAHEAAGAALGGRQLYLLPGPPQPAGRRAEGGGPERGTMATCFPPPEN